jgi:ABC-type transport system substrate-binding protein
MTLSAHPEFASHIGTSDDLLEMTFAPRTFVTNDINVRKALALSIQRQLILNSLWGSVTFSPAPATSMLLAQGQSGYPGGSGPGPTQSSTTTSVVNSETTSTTPTSTGNTVGDCLACAISLLTKDAGFKIVGGIYRNATNKALVVHMAVGPSNLERITANLIAAQWRKIGIVVYEYLFSDNASAQDAVARNRYDVGIITRTASTTPSVLARSFYGESFTDSYSSAVRTALLNKQFNSAISNFNPVNAINTWKAFDQTVLSQFWVRPIVTLPTMTIWSNSLSNAFGSLSVQGFVDQIPLWGTVVTTPSK